GGGTLELDLFPAGDRLVRAGVGPGVVFVADNLLLEESVQRGPDLVGLLPQVVGYVPGPGRAAVEGLQVGDDCRLQLAAQVLLRRPKAGPAERLFVERDGQFLLVHVPAGDEHPRLLVAPVAVEYDDAVAGPGDAQGAADLLQDVLAGALAAVVQH